VGAVRLFPPELPLPLAFPFANPLANPLANAAQDERAVAIDRRFGERLAAVDQLRPGQRSLRAGWLFVAGSRDAGGGRRQRIFHPLVTVPVRVQRILGLGASLLPAGDRELTPLITDGEARRRLEDEMQFGGGALESVDEAAVPRTLLGRLGRLRQFAHATALEAGFRAPHIVPADQGPDSLLRSDDLVVVAGVGVYAVHETGGTSRAASLRAWADGSLDRRTAFHSLYFGPSEAAESSCREEAAVESPYLLTPVQKMAVSQSRSDPLSVVSGAPGTGKSHTVAAIACDALARRQRVLIAAKSDATVDALLDLLERGPGPDPVVFGSNERREALAARLAGGQVRPSAGSDLSAARERVAAATERRDRVRSHIAERLQAELLGGDTDDDLVVARVAAPHLFDPAQSVPGVDELLERATEPGSGWLSGRRRRKALAALREVVGATTDVGVETIRLALESRSAERITWSSLRAVAAVSTALRSGRAARREQLRRLDDDKLTRALPLWVGTLSDIDDLLPSVPALFDLVVLDEASSIDQPLAAPALLRAGRAVIVGDPRQLRHVSFLSEQQLRAATAANGLDEDPALAARLDVRRNSTFDLAVGVVPVVTLDEQFRSDPHLVEFVSRKLYGGELQVARRSPRTEGVDCIRRCASKGGATAVGWWWRRSTRS